MQTIKGKIQKINPTRVGYGLLIDGSWYNQKGKCNYEVGDAVKIDYEVNGDFRNITDIAEVEINERDIVLDTTTETHYGNPAFYGMILNNAFALTMAEKPADFFKKLNENFNRVEEFAIEKWRQKGLLK